MTVFSQKFKVVGQLSSEEHSTLCKLDENRPSNFATLVKSLFRLSYDASTIYSIEEQQQIDNLCHLFDITIDEHESFDNNQNEIFVYLQH